MAGRMPQVNEVIRKELAAILQRDFEMPGVLVTVTNVDCAPDLTVARVWISVLPDNRIGTTIEALRTSSGHIRSLLTKRVKLRRMPALRFIIDDTEARAAKIEDAVARMRKEGLNHDT